MKNTIDIVASHARPTEGEGLMMRFKQSIIIFFSILAVGGCATLPTGPSVTVLPAPGKSFDQFRAEDAACRQWAQQQLGTSPQQTYEQNVATGAAAGTAIGAGVGAAIGSGSGHAGEGALIGAVGGLLVGSSAGSEAGQASGSAAQRRYDISYIQCMYAYGNQVPGYGHQEAPAPPEPAGATAPPELYLNEAPQFIYSPELNVYVAVGVPYDLVYTGSAYFYFYGGRWYRGRYYTGPWVAAAPRYYPPVLFRYRVEQIRHYRDNEFRRYHEEGEHYRGRFHRPEYRGRGHR